MASVTVPVKHLDEITECSICANIFTDPKVLPCIHTFCLRCLETLGKQKEAGEKLPCPLCRKDVTIPEGGFGSFPRNYFVEKLLEVRKLTNILSHKDVVCEMCCEVVDKSTGETKKAAVYCVDCRLNMCEQCFTCHKKIRLSPSHKYVELHKELGSDDLLMKFPESLCDSHPNKELEIYCFDCAKPACVMCYITSHNSHKCSDVKQAAEEMSKQIKTDSDGMARKVNEYKEMLHKLAQQQTTFADKINKIQNEIMDTAEKMKQMVDEYKCKLLSELEAAKKKREKKIENEREEVERMLLMAESFQKYSTELRSKGTACDISRASSGLHVRAKELIEFDVSSEFEVDSSSVDVTFASCISVDEVQRAFGDLKVTERKEIVFNDDFSGVNKPAYIIPSTGQGVSGVTSLGDEVFVVRTGVAKIDVYDAVCFSLRRSLTVSGSTSNTVRSLAVCSTNNCIYMSEFSSHNIFRVELTGNNTVTNWSVGQKPRGMSLNRDHNVIVACESVNKLQEFTTRGTLVREITLQSDVTNPLNVVQLSSGQFGVTHGGSLHRYCVVGIDGRVIKSYGSSQGAGGGQMTSPFGLTVNKAGSVFIGDYRNNRILKLDPSTFTSSQLTVEGGLTNPYCVHYDKSRGRLYIAELYGGYRVIVLGR